MRNKDAQMSLFDTYTNVAASAHEDKPKFFRLLERHIKWDELIPGAFYFAFYSHMGRKREYSLESFIKMLVLQRIFGYVHDIQLLNTLRHSREMREYCGLRKVPDASKITRFKQDFIGHLEALFARLVDLTEPICREMNKELADCLIFDTTGVESYVKENNPKFMSAKLKQAKSISKLSPGFDAYRGVYGLLPDAAASNPAVRQQYINGHFCYAQKAAVVTNALGIVRHIALLSDDFKQKHPEMNIDKRSDNPDLDKEIGDSKALGPVLRDFFGLHPNLKYGTFIGDSAFDSYDNYSLLMKDFKFGRAVIPLNLRNSENSSADFNEYGIPVCPDDGTPFTYLGISGGKNRSRRMKFVCHKSLPLGTSRVCICKTPCTDSIYGRCVYTYPDKDLRLYPGIARGSDDWVSIYGTRVVIERSINSFKSSFCLDGRLTSNPKTTNADLFLAGIVQLVGVFLAKEIHQLHMARRLRKLVA